jgi:hypothetical protein
MVSRRKTSISTSDDNHIRIVAATQGFIDALVLKIDCFEPIVINKIFVKIRRPEIPTPIMRAGIVVHPVKPYG